MYCPVCGGAAPWRGGHDDESKGPYGSNSPYPGVVLWGTGTGMGTPTHTRAKDAASASDTNESTLVPLTVVEGPSDEGHVSTENTVIGDCGYAWTYLVDVGGNDDIGFITYGARSTLGNIVRVSWETHLHWGYFGTLPLRWSGTEWRWPWQGSTWSKSYYFDISPWGDGLYTADLWYLDVWTAWGYHCVGLWPFDYEYIT